jgi:ATP-binding cassette subfamily B protein RaxB
MTMTVTNLFKDRRRPGAKRIEPVLQTTATDCALACLAMVLRAHGSEVNREGLRSSVEPSVHGVSVSQIIAVAGGFGLSGRAVRASLSDLSALRAPAILHWNFNHFVVLERYGAHEAIVVDPSKGRLRLSLGELSDHYTGIAIEFTRMPEYRAVRQLLRVSLADLWNRIDGVKQSVGFVSALSVFIELLVLAPPLLFSLVVDQAVGYASVPMLFGILLAIGVAYVVVAAGELLRRYLLLSLGTQLTAQINLNLVQHLLRLPFPFFQQRRLNDLLSRVESTRALKDALTEGAVPIVVDGLFSLFILASLFVLLPIAGVICCVFFILYTALKIGTYPKLRELAEKAIDTLSDERGQLMDSLRGIQTVKVHNGEAPRLSAWHGANLAALKSSQDQQRLVALATGGKNVLAGLEFVALIWVCASHVISGGMTLGILFAVVALRQQFQDRSYPVVEHLQNFKLLRMRLERLADITNSPPESTPSTNAAEHMMPFVHRGKIAVRGLSFRYAPGSPWILKNLDLDVAPSEFVAIRGKSGEGKSTLVRILLGLIPAESGEVSVDDVPLGRGNIVAYRCGVGAVLQDDQLFSGTLFDNISGFDVNTSEQDVVRAATLACIHDDIMKMPMSYFSLIGDMGSSLSGGQRQRILLARALYRRPRILFLDEGTANLDMACETEIVRNLKTLNISIICVAHRARMLDEADRVLEMRDGECHATPSFARLEVMN